LTFTRIWKTPAWVHYFTERGEVWNRKAGLMTPLFFIEESGLSLIQTFLIYFQTVIAMVIIIL
jgi:hypothetical protein